MFHEALLFGDLFPAIQAGALGAVHLLWAVPIVTMSQAFSLGGVLRCGGAATATGGTATPTGDARRYAVPGFQPEGTVSYFDGAVPIPTGGARRYDLAGLQPANAGHRPVILQLGSMTG
jgi:hypothetical protein